MSDHPRTPLTDPNVHLPPAVRRNAARAERLIRESTGQPEPEVKGEGEKQDGAQQQAEQKDKQRGEQKSEGDQKQEPVTPRSNEGRGNDGRNGNDQGGQPSTQPPGTREAEQQPNGQGDDTWEHRYKSLDGRYRVSQNQLRELTGQVTNMQRVMATLQAGAPSAPVATEHTFKPLVTDEERSEYGEELLGVVGKRAQEVFSPELAALKAEFEGLKKQVGHVGNAVVMDARGRMEQTLDDDSQIGAAATSWRDINADPKFLDWLRLPDPYSGAIRHVLLTQAYEQNDTVRVARFFKGFLTEEAVLDPAMGQPHSQPGNTSQGNPPAPRVPLEKLAAPGRAKSAASNPAEKPIITRSEIAAFYADVAANKYRGKDAEKNSLEKQIFEAQNEGRIR